MSFFARPVLDAEELLNAKFYLLNHGGGGYTDVGVDGMTIEEMLWHVRKVSEKITAENQAREQAVRAAQQRRR